MNKSEKKVKYSKPFTRFYASVKQTLTQEVSELKKAIKNISCRERYRVASAY